MRRLVFATFCAAVLGIASLPAAALAQAAAAPAAKPAAPAPAPVSVKGVIASLDGSKMTVKDAAGAMVVVMLADDLRVFQIKKIDISAIEPGSYVATTNVDQPDGSGKSTELRVFAPAMKGLGEGHYTMNQGPGVMMTNGTVTNQVTATPRGREMDVAYDGKGGKGVRHIVVPQDMTIRAMGPVERAFLKPGIAIACGGVPGADGVLVTHRIAVGENGAPPAT